ncbi:hypothetical protein [Variovorax sp. LjRoot178]|uniref:hypothetical protein n=1 Tax=Variovorax sp. LjRoot178 TaxID=3342277 RepID=UPI003ECF4958
MAIPTPIRIAGLSAAMRSVFSSSIMSSAARTAAALWSGSGSGAPKMVISPSPSSGDLRRKRKSHTVASGTASSFSTESCGELTIDSPHFYGSAA